MTLPEKLKRLAAFEGVEMSYEHMEVPREAAQAENARLQPLIEALIDECVKALEIYADPEEWTINALENGFNRHGYDRVARKALTALEKLSGDVK